MTLCAFILLFIVNFFQWYHLKWYPISCFAITKQFKCGCEGAQSPSPSSGLEVEPDPPLGMKNISQGALATDGENYYYDYYYYGLLLFFIISYIYYYYYLVYFSIKQKQISLTKSSIICCLKSGTWSATICRVSRTQTESTSLAFHWNIVEVLGTHSFFAPGSELW